VKLGHTSFISMVVLLKPDKAGQPRKERNMIKVKKKKGGRLEKGVQIRRKKCNAPSQTSMKEESAIGSAIQMNWKG